MRILLQHQRTGEYLREPGDWVRDPGDAFDFPSSTQAIEFCQMHRLSDVKLVFQFQNHHAYIERPLGQEQFLRA